MTQAARKPRKTATPPAVDPAGQQFLRLMSHEMRTPLNGVIGMIGLLQRTRLDGAQRAYADNALQSAEHLLGLVNDLLDYARLEAGRLEFDQAISSPLSWARGLSSSATPRASPSRSTGARSNSSLPASRRA